MGQHWQQRDKINVRYRSIGRCDSYKRVNSLHLQKMCVCLFFFFCVLFALFTIAQHAGKRLKKYTVMKKKKDEDEISKKKE